MWDKPNQVGMVEILVGRGLVRLKMFITAFIYLYVFECVCT